MNKATVTESLDENGKIVTRVTVTEEEDYPPYYSVINGWYWPEYPREVYDTNGA